GPLSQKIVVLFFGTLDHIRDDCEIEPWMVSPGLDPAIVVFVNPDHVGKVRLVAHGSITLRPHIDGPGRVTVGVISVPRCAPVRDSRVAPPNRSSATFREAPKIDDSGSTVVGLAHYSVVGVEVWRSHHESLHCRRLASQGLSPVLDLEGS